MFIVKSSKTASYLAVTTVLLAVISQCQVSGEPEPETAWTEDPPQMTTEKVRLGDRTLKLEKRDLIQTVLFKLQDSDITQNAPLDFTHESVDDVARGVAQHKLVGGVLQGRVTLKPEPRADRLGHRDGSLQPADELFKKSTSQNRETSQTSDGNGVNNELKFMSSSTSQGRIGHKINEIGHSNSAPDEVVVVPGDNDTTKSTSDTTKSTSDTRSLSTNDTDIVLVEVRPEAVDLDIADEFPDVSFVKVEDLPPTQVVIEHLLEGAVNLFQDSDKLENPFLEMLKHNKAFFSNRLKAKAEGREEKVAFFDADVNPEKSSGLILAKKDLNTVVSPRDNVVVNGDKREKRSVPFVGMFPAPAPQPVARDNSTRLNDTHREPGKQRAPTQEEELKISRIGYIIFEKNGKIKETRESSVSDLSKVSKEKSTMDRLHKPLRKKLVQTCRHGQYVHPIGQPHEPTSQNAGLLPKLGHLLELQGSLNKPDAMTNGQRKMPNDGINQQGNNFGQNNLGPDSFGMNNFDQNKFGPNNFEPNSIEILTIPHDSINGLPKKEFVDIYESQAQTTKEKRHYSSYASAFHVLLIIAICVATFVTVLYLSTKYRSEQGRPKRINSHSALFETNPKYEKY
ncbi:hypothetical protein Btru_054687 [Bulinus truncatus]|nr:hypothetical protein Btru_054687 [Bulinus truncatus]